MAALPGVPPLVGDWEVEATVPGGGFYSGRVAGRAVGDTVELEWEITAGRYVGIGLGGGGVWCVACGESWEGLGLALLREDGSVRWSPAPRRGTVATAVLAPAGADAWVAVPGSGAGFPFASLVLSAEGEVREAFLAGDPVGRGLALAFPGGHAVGWYPRLDQLAVLRYAPGRQPGAWEAVWALGGRPGLAVETLWPRR